jgi:serine/threonine protein kinase
MEMSPAQWERVKELYEAAMECAPAQRTPFLESREKDVAIREEVLRLLIENDTLGSFLSTPAYIDPTPKPVFPSERLKQGEVLAGRFRILGFIAAGGMGEVYEAEDLVLKDNLALKTVRPEILQQNNSLARFKREVQLARKVTHPNVCRVFDLFWHKRTEVDGEDLHFFVSMELLKGETLSERLRRAGRFRPNDALPVINQIAEGLEAAHRVGVVHRDLKPGNVILVPGREHSSRAVITDFGLALPGDSDGNKSADITASHGLLGTPAYMAPEQIEGKAVTKLADIYALGLIIYEMVTAEHAFPAATPLASAAKRLSNQVVSPKQFVPELSDVWEQTINRCLQPNPADRYSSALDIAKALSGELTNRSADYQHRDNDASILRRLLQKYGSSSKLFLQTIVVFLSILIAVVGYRFWNKQVRRHDYDPKLRQLTASSADNFIEYAIISPDGKYLVYLEKAGSLFLSSIETGETRVLASSSGDIYPQSWYPGGSQLVVTKWGDVHLWKLSVLTGKLSQLGNSEGRGGSVSPDGLHILYASHDGLWIMGPDGQAAHRVMAVDPTDSLGDFNWAPTGRRFIYSITRPQPDGKVDTVIESRDVEGRQPAAVIVSSRDLVTAGAGGGGTGALSWLPDGRVIYSLDESTANQRGSDLWTINVDPTDGKAQGEQERLTNLAGFMATNLSATADGKQLVFMKTQMEGGICFAAVLAGPKSGLGKPHRLTTDTWGTWVDGWSPDSRSVYISSNRTGRFGIYRQSIDQPVSEPMILGTEDYYDVHPSSDGALLLYTAAAKLGTLGTPGQGRLMSRPVEGGSPSVLAEGNYEYQCALPPSRVCIMSEQKKNQRDYYWLDPKLGPTARPFTSTGKVNDWRLSPDGQQIAFSPEDDKGRVHILAVNNKKLRRLDLGRWTQSQSMLQSLSWFPNGRGLYVTAFLPSGTTLLSVTLDDGDVRVLLEAGHNWVGEVRAAPNGRVLAFSLTEVRRDVEMIEKF